MKKIEGSPKNLKQLLQNTKYSIHYYQREYMWQRRHIEELVDDLTSEFLDSYNPSDNRQAVQDYGAYFLGSVVLAGRENAIIDGQQRFSSLTLLLIYLRNRLKLVNEKYDMIDQMIFSESFGTKSFNINVNDRYECMSALFNDQPFDISESSESVTNLYERYNDIFEVFPSEINNETLLHFCDWVVEKIFFIEIVASTEQDAHKIFVAMNDRGLSLTSTEMLKGYILSEIKNDTEREKLNSLWKEKVIKLKSDDDRGDETFIKAWLRAQYAQTIRETKAGAINKDFDIIGGPFHKWVRDEKEQLELNSDSDYEMFINRFSKYADVYLFIKRGENTFAEETMYVFFNAKLNFTLQPQLLLAPICYEDSWEMITEKINLVARYIDLYIVTRVTNYKSTDYSTIKNYVFNLTKEIRRISLPDLKKKLKENFQNMEYNAEKTLPEFRLNSFTKKYIKHMLARIISYIEKESGVAPNYLNYIDTKTKNPFEIEHIISDHYEWFTDEYADQEDFKRWRNNVGALLLLHKSINASLNDAKYEDKLIKYCSNEGNIYTETLGQQAYRNNPRFLSFMNKHSLPFEPYSQFEKKEIVLRNKLFTKLFQLVWNDSLFE